MRKISLLLLIVSFGSGLIAQEHKSKLRKGNEAFEKGFYNAAEKLYSESFELDPSYNKAEFNKANSQYRKENFLDAGKAFTLQAEKLEEKEDKAKAFHNLGNSLMSNYFQCKKLSEQIQNPDTVQILQQRAMEALQYSERAYKNALRNSSTDDETRYNYAVAKKLLEKEMSEQGGGGGQGDQDKEDEGKQQEQEKDPNKDKGEQEQEQNNGEEQEGESEKEDEREQKGDEKEGEKEGQNKDNEAKSLSKQEAEQILEALRNKEQKLHQQLKKKKRPSKAIIIEKDW